MELNKKFIEKMGGLDCSYLKSIGDNGIEDGKHKRCINCVRNASITLEEEVFGLKR